MLPNKFAYVLITGANMFVLGYLVGRKKENKKEGE